MHWTEIDWKRINPIHDDLLAKVRSETGRAWKDANGELHSHYKEMPFWIVLHEDGDVRQAHAVFREIVRPALSEIEPVQCTVGYSVVKDGKRRHYFLGTNAEILNDGGLLDD
ncbi:hypothetical protein SAMN05444389_102383 [Paracoccus solventivorans]|uniref:Uncharacterized protein n=1 Tax=Paracoccus solventivorans TaxID=53463 RepID=A0A1M7EY02_9RHOB|nr:hypothetical protein [Paracoccus solventivorans]MCO5156638.1 hypothetical protein [Aquamicrobium sp.]SHL96329.1 hypothetical protein SAMN05444389_102383 [Paracoccus solventivorans]